MRPLEIGIGALGLTIAFLDYFQLSGPASEEIKRWQLKPLRWFWESPKSIIAYMIVGVLFVMVKSCSNTTSQDTAQTILSLILGGGALCLAAVFALGILQIALMALNLFPRGIISAFGLLLAIASFVLSLS